MKTVLIILISFLACNISAQDYSTYLGFDKEFKKGKIHRIFGNNVQLRVSPNQDSNVLATLQIGASVEIIEKSNISKLVYGLESPWYKVKYKNKVGYILGGYISQIALKQDKFEIYVGLARKDESLFVSIRATKDSSENYFENTSEFLGNHSGFTVKAFDNKGLHNISCILYLEYYPESGGANFGGYYLFLNSNGLNKVIDLARRGDIGFGETEKLIFPADPNGIKGKIIYEKTVSESEDVYNDANNEYELLWEKSKSLKVISEWSNNKLIPNPKDFSIN